MAIITHALLQDISTGFKAAFQKGLQSPAGDYQEITTTIPSKTNANLYGWLGQFPEMREWIGDRVLNNMNTEAYIILNKLFEDTIAVKRTDIEDDNVGMYAPLFTGLGEAARRNSNKLVFQKLAAGEVDLCYDGQAYFDEAHPVYENHDGTGAVTLVSNVKVGASPAWYLLDCSRSLKPMIWQSRTEVEMQAMTKTDDESVFMRDEYRYGARARGNAGYGFWQMAFKSTEDLNSATLNAAYDAMRTMKGNGGQNYDLRGTVLMYDPRLRSTATELVTADKLDGGKSNPNKGLVKLLDSVWVA